MIDRYLYLEAARRGRRGDLPAATAELLAAMVALAHDQANQPDHHRFAEDALATLVSHPGLSQLGRLCLAQFAPGSPTLWVVGSANRPGMSFNVIHEGYHCFIADGSSLSRLDEGRLRHFPDARTVMDSFAEAGLPPQRTIRLVSEMGMRAGLAIPLRLGGARGVLFLNSLRPDETAWMDPDLAMAFTFLAQICRSRLCPVCPSDLPADAPARPLQAGVFADELTRRCAAAWGGGPERIVVDHAPVLWCQGTAVHAVLAAIETLGVGPDRLSVVVQPGGGRHVRIAVEPPREPPTPPAPTLPGRRLHLAERLCPWRIPVDLTASGAGLVLAVPSDADFHRAERDGIEVCYSI
jgi:hypothetical protein